MQYARFLALYLFIGKENDNHFFFFFISPTVVWNCFPKVNSKSLFCVFACNETVGGKDMTQDGQEQHHWHTHSLSATLAHDIISKCYWFMIMSHDLCYWVMIVKQLKCVQRHAITCLFFPQIELPVCVTDCATGSLMNVYRECKNSYWHLYHNHKGSKNSLLPTSPKTWKAFLKEENCCLVFCKPLYLYWVCMGRFW